MTKIDSQKRIVRNMISLYSRHKTGTYKLNGSYKELAEYCERRLDHCYWGNKKPSCKNCSIHCYNKAKREEIKKIIINTLINYINFAKNIKQKKKS